MARAYRTTAVDMSGMKFGMLTAVRPTERRIGNNVGWLCRCDCGNTAIVPTNNLRTGNTKSCGCWKIQRPMKHGSARNSGRTKEYNAWNSMLRRCQNPRHKNFNRYGGRGITVCERWRDFANFLADMGPRPPGLTLERKDNSSGYSPDNCKWASYSEQNRNTRQSRYVTIGDQTRCLADWAKEVGLSVSTINVRIHRGWSPERAILTPAK